MDRRSFLASLFAAATIKAAPLLVPKSLLRHPTTDEFWNKAFKAILLGKEFKPLPIYIVLLDENRCELDPRIHTWYSRKRAKYVVLEDGSIELESCEWQESGEAAPDVVVTSIVLLSGNDPVSIGCLHHPAPMSSRSRLKLMNIEVVHEQET